MTHSDPAEDSRVTESSVPAVAPESSAPIYLWAIPLVGAVLVPGLWWTSADRPFPFRPDLFLTMTFFVAVVAVVVFALLSGGFRRRPRWAMGVTTSVVLTGFLWRMFTIAGQSVADATGLSLTADVVPVALAGALLWLTVRLAGERLFAVITSAAMVATVGVMGLVAVGLVAPAPPAMASETAAAGSPDVLLLVLDGYARADWLAEEYNFDNGEFLGELESRGFAVAAAATPNYGYTYASVSTMLNLDYVFAPGEITAAEQEQMRAALTGAAGMIPAFKEAGYEITYLENAWGGSQCGSAVDHCIRDGLLDRSLWTLSQMTILAPLADKMRPDAFHTVSVRHLNSLDDYVTEPSADGAPRLLFLHLLLPHSPLLLDADCVDQDEDELTYWGLGSAEVLAARRANYVEQMRCVNSKVVEAIDGLIATNPQAIVMITGDHGPGSLLDVNRDLAQLSDEALAERMKTLSAYRLPGCEASFRVDLTPANGTRIITNCALNSGLEPLSDENLWADLDGHGMVTDIASRVGS